MNSKHNVTISVDEFEFEILEELNEELKKQSFKGPNRTETVKYAIKFTRDNLDILDLVEKLKEELAVVKKKNELFEQSFIEFQNKIKL